MRNKFALLTIMSCVLAASPLFASEQSCNASATKQERPRQNMFKQLNLTPDQKDKLKALRKELMESSKPIFEQMKAMREKVKAELLKNEPAQSSLDDYAAQLADLEKQMGMKWNSHLLKIKAILSPEQFSKLVNSDWARGPGMGGMHRGEKDGDGDRHLPGADNGKTGAPGPDKE